MIIALISDIHANYFYFEKVLAEIQHDKVDKIICLGDLIGYYDKPNEVIDLCKENSIECIQGNHEEYILGAIEYNRDKEYLYRIGKHKKILSDENKRFLKDLPKEITINYENLSIYCTHSLPGNCIKYLYNPNELKDEYILEYDYYCSGHTHIPYIQYKFGTCMINPGSIGQPRDYTVMPSYALIDLVNKEVKIKKLEVDVDVYIENLKKRDIPKELIDILKRKK